MLEEGDVEDGSDDGHQEGEAEDGDGEHTVMKTAAEKKKEKKERQKQQRLQVSEMEWNICIRQKIYSTIGLKFDDGTAAFCRHVLPTGRHASWSMARLAVPCFT